jgi:hypothetical protein
MNYPCDPKNRVLFPRDTTPFEMEGTGPSWLVTTDGMVLLRCACGVLLGNPTLHSIDADGTVNASIVCAKTSMGRPPCGFHVFGKLGDWTYGPMKANTPKFIPTPGS